MAKFFTNKFLLLYVIFIICVLGCQTNSQKDFTKPDYTNSKILEKEIDRLRIHIDNSSVETLWQAFLLYDDTKNDMAITLYKDTINTVIKKFNDSIKNKAWFNALRYADSLLLLNTYVEEKLLFQFDDDFFTKYSLAKESYNNIAKLKETSVYSDKGTTESFATFISGVVTVWVDLGVKIEKGVGYANRSIGSGFFIDERGYIITNHHVIADLVDPEYEGYSKLYIKLSSDNETRIPATVIGWDKTLDLALLKTEITPPYVYELGSSMYLSIGTPIYAIGSPVGLENTITSGIISAFDRNLLSTASVMQIDAAVNAGNSGGPIINTNGQVQGIVFAGLPAYQGLNFAIPIEYLQTILQRLYSKGMIEHTWIGAYGKTIKEFPSDKKGKGIEVSYVMPGSSAYHAGIKRGDIINSINGITLQSIEDLQYLLLNLSPKSIVSIGVKDTIEGKEKLLPIFLDVRPEYPGYEIYKREPIYKAVYPLFGMELLPASTRNSKKFTVLSIIKGSIADESGFSIHDPIEIRNTKLSPDKNALYLETFTKKRKNGYFEVNVGIGASLDSNFIF